MSKKLRIGSRKSDLARLQAWQVAQAISKIKPELQIEFLFKSSFGDKNLDEPLWQMQQKGVFTKDLSQELIDGNCDLVVHSWKDLPTAALEETRIAGSLKRADPRDVLLLRKDKTISDGVLRILSSSPRRAHHLEKLLPELLPSYFEEIEFLNIRGNIPTRIGKLLDHEQAHGLVMAKAALDRLALAPESEFPSVATGLAENLAGLRCVVLPFFQNPPAAAQGGLALEVRKDNTQWDSLWEELCHPESLQAIQKERQIFSGYGGGCHQKIGVGVLNRDYGTISVASGLDPNGSPIDEYEFESTEALPRFEAMRLWSSARHIGLKTARRSLSIEKPKTKKPACFFVSRAEAWPANWQQDEGELLIVPGLSSWRKLVARGLWVHACHEGLGELDELAQMGSILGGREIFKLSHTQAFDYTQGRNLSRQACLASYEIDYESSGTPMDWEQFEGFFWSSASQFELFAKGVDSSKYKEKWHFCGPGHSFYYLKQRLPVERLRVVPSVTWLETWLSR